VNTISTAVASKEFHSPLHLRPDAGYETAMMRGLPCIVQDFEGIDLAGVVETKARLLFRVESKYLMTAGECRQLIGMMSDSYMVMEVHNTRMGGYRTCYYDDSTFTTYLQHHNGKANRYKLRLRHYESSGETYLEVKKKTNKGSTEKWRIETSWPPAGLTVEEEEFLEMVFPYDHHRFNPVLTTTYERLTLVSKEFPERVTFDTGISFGNGQQNISYPGIVICEIKREKGLRTTPAQSAIRSMGLQERAFSKYCTGVSLLYDRLKHNRFKPNLRLLSRLSTGGNPAC